MNPITRYLFTLLIVAAIAIITMGYVNELRNHADHFMHQALRGLPE